MTNQAVCKPHPAVLWALLLLLPGCLTGPGVDPADLEPLPQDLTTTEPRYWLERPAVVHVEHDDFHALWAMCERVARLYQFELDRIDYRQGVLTTLPMVSQQFFEFWRRDTATRADLAESTLGTVRRTLHFEFERVDQDRWRVAPKVVVERYTHAERRITTVILYQAAFARTDARGTREADRGIHLPARYWSAIGRDDALEQRIAQSVGDRLVQD